MARLVLDIDADEPGRGGSDLVPEGTYDAVIDDVVQAQVKNGDNAGKPMYRVTFKIDGGSQNGRKATSTVCLWKGALISLFQLMEAIGRPVDTKSNKLEVPEPKELIGKKVAIRIKHEPYNDEMTYKVKRVLARKAGFSTAGPAGSTAPGGRVSSPRTGARVPFASAKKPEPEASEPEASEPGE